MTRGTHLWVVSKRVAGLAGQPTAEKKSGIISISYRYIVYDFYDWNESDDFGFGGLKNSDMYKLHHAGWARNYRIYSEFEVKNATIE